jgi:hypothetical protein
VLDDITAPRLAALGDTLASYDVAVDRGLLHGLPRAHWTAYAASLTGMVSPGGALLIVAHDPPATGTQPIHPDDLRTPLPAFTLLRTVPTTLAGAAAQLFELERR